MPPSKLSEVAEAAKLHKLAAKLARRHEEKEQRRQTRKAQWEREAAEWDAKQAKLDAYSAAYEERRRAECEQDPTNPRNVAWMKQREKWERLERSR